MRFEWTDRAVVIDLKGFKPPAKNRALFFSSILSLLVSFTSMAVWLGDGTKRLWTFDSNNARLYVATQHDFLVFEFIPKQPPQVEFFEHEWSSPLGLKYVHCGGLYRGTPQHEVYRIDIAYVFVAVLGLILPVVRFAFIPLLRLRVRSFFIREGCCTHCGYDLRATPDRCPECGAMPHALPNPKAAA